VKRLHTFKR